MLAAVLYHGAGYADMPELRHQRLPSQFLPLARVLQLDAKPGNLYHIQPGLSAGIRANPVWYTQAG